MLPGIILNEKYVCIQDVIAISFHVPNDNS